MYGGSGQAASEIPTGFVLCAGLSFGLLLCVHSSQIAERFVSEVGQPCYP